MPRLLKLTGLAHGNLDKLDDICPGNAVFIEREEKYDKPEGKAYKATCKGLTLGYIPLVQTLRGYYKEAYSPEQKKRIFLWGEDTVAVRGWLESRERYNMETEWVSRVKTLLYDHDGVHLPQDNGKVAAVAVIFAEIE